MDARKPWWLVYSTFPPAVVQLIAMIPVTMSWVTRDRPYSTMVVVAIWLCVALIVAVLLSIGALVWHRRQHPADVQQWLTSVEQ